MKKPSHEKINYIELPSTDLTATKAFFHKALAWAFEDYGSEYCAFAPSAGIDGGFFQSDRACSTDTGSALVVLYSENLEETQKKVEEMGGKIVKPIFTFPGGRRFHFCEPGGSELAVWSDIVQ